MQNRRRVGGRKDKKYFSKNAVKTKKINVNPPPMRGGIRL